MGDVHGYDAESSLGFRSLFQFGHDEIQTPATLGVSVSAFDGIALTGITVEQSLNLLICGIGLPSPKRRAGEADVVSLAESAVFAGLVDSVGQDGFGVTSRETLPKSSTRKRDAFCLGISISMTAGQRCSAGTGSKGSKLQAPSC